MEEKEGTMDLLDNLICKGEHVPVGHYDGNRVAVGMSSMDVKLPRLDIYQFDTEHEVHAWASSETDMFEIVEQIMLMFNPYVSHHPFVLTETERKQHGPVYEFICKVKNV